MGLEEGFLHEIRREPQSDDLRLIFADWLEDHDDLPRAELIRLQCRHAQLPYRDYQSVQLRAQIHQVIEENKKRWRGRIPKGLSLAFRLGLFKVTLPSNALNREKVIDWWTTYQPWIEKAIFSGTGDVKIKDLIRSNRLHLLSTLAIRHPLNIRGSIKTLNKLDDLQKLEINLDRSTTDRELKDLESLHQIQALDLCRERHVPESGVSRVPRLPNLRQLKVRLDLQSEGVEGFRSLPNLRNVTLGLYELDKSDRLDALGELQDLNRIYFYYGVDPAKEVGKLARAANLREFRITHILLSEATVQAVSRLRQVETLRLCPTERVGRDWMSNLKPLTKLRDLDLSESGYISQGNFKHLTSLEHLETLNLDNSNVTATALRTLTSIPSLKRLYLRNASLSSKQYKPLASMPNLESLDLTSSTVDDEALHYVEEMPSLKWVNLNGARTSRRAIRQLRKARKDVIVESS